MSVKIKIIYSDFLNGKIDKSTLINHVISILNQSYDFKTRINCIYILGKKQLISDQVFRILENLLISESNNKIREICVNILGKYYFNQAFIPLKFAYFRDPSLEIRLKILSIFESKNDNTQIKDFLIREINNKKNDDYFSKSLKFKEKNFSKLSPSSLIEILTNYQIIKYLEKKISNLEYQTKKGIIKKIILSDLNLKSHRGTIFLHHLLEFLERFEHLEELSLKNSNVKEIGKFIKNLPLLKKLDLQKNNITRLSDEFCMTKTLDWVNLDYNNIKILNPQIKYMSSLKYLSLRHNKLERLPSSFENLKKLEVIDLYGNQFTEIPNILRMLVNLHHIDLGLNKLNFIPPWMNKMINLTTLGLGGNKRVANTFENISSLRNLQNLYLFNLELNNFPDFISNLENLEILFLNNNQIKEVPDFVKKLGNLIEIDLSWNNFDEFPTLLLKIKSLKKINLNGNKIRVIPERVLKARESKEITLRFNK